MPYHRRRATSPSPHPSRPQTREGAGAMNDQRIAVITDSGTDVDATFARVHDVRVVPLRIIYSDGSTFQSGVDISPDEVVRRLAEEIPTTSLPSPKQIQATIEQARDDGYQSAVVVTIASALSATNQTAHMVAESMDFPVTVVDTKSIGMMAGFVVERAVEMIEAGAPYEELGDRLADVAEKTDVFFAVKSLEYLYKGGRINKHIYRIGSMLNIKPVLTCNEGGYYVMAKKARGWEKALSTMVELCAEKAGRYERCHIGLCASINTKDLLDDLEARIREKVPNVASVQRYELSADLLVHTGPDLVGMGAQEA